MCSGVNGPGTAQGAMQDTLPSEQLGDDLVRLWRRRQVLSPQEMGALYRMARDALGDCNPPELRVLGEGRGALVAQFVHAKVLRFDADVGETCHAAAASGVLALCACFHRYLVDCTRASASRRRPSSGGSAVEDPPDARPGGAETGDEAMARLGLDAPSLQAAARAFIAGLSEAERVLLRERAVSEAGDSLPSGAPRHVIAACHYRAGRLGLMHRREGLPGGYGGTALGQWITKTLGVAVDPETLGAILQLFEMPGARASDQPRRSFSLWPPLSVVRRSLARDNAALEGALGDAASLPGETPAAASVESPDEADEALLLLPLTDVARRREAVARRGFSARWEPGRLVSVMHEGRTLGVLLDRRLHDSLWRCWMAASETDWASASDVLLEPGDEPFEPLFGLVQAWNVITLDQSPQLFARVFGEVSATRLAAIRAVHDEWAVQRPLAIEPELGRIALRTVGGVFSVLTGTPLGVDDPRADYQSLYLEAATRLSARLQAPPSSTTVGAPAADGWWRRARRWFAADAWVRPALALLALVLVVQNAARLRAPADEGDEAQSRLVPTAPASEPARAAAADLALRWRADVGLDDAAALLRMAGAEVVGGPDADGSWRLHLVDVESGKAVLAASPLVESVEPR